jgi:hypothetical protein
VTSIQKLQQDSAYFIAEAYRKHNVENLAEFQYYETMTTKTNILITQMKLIKFVKSWLLVQNLIFFQYHIQKTKN